MSITVPCLKSTKQVENELDYGWANILCWVICFQLFGNQNMLSLNYPLCAAFLSSQFFCFPVPAWQRFRCEMNVSQWCVARLIAKSNAYPYKSEFSLVQFTCTSFVCRFNVLG